MNYLNHKTSSKCLSTYSVFNVGMSTAGRTTSMLHSNRRCRSAVPVPGFKKLCIYIGMKFPL